MTRTPPASSNPTPAPSTQPTPAPAPPPPGALPPLKPRRALFYILLAAFFAWCLVILAMWATTVYPHPEIDPHRPHPTTTRAD